jgi:Ion transport protein
MSARKFGLDHFPKPIEYAILFLIILVIGLIFLEEIAIIYAWSGEQLAYLIWAAFFFDAVFSLEFAARAVYTGRHGFFWHYIKHQRGWIDFVSSFPLLLLISGPALYLLLAQDGGEGQSLAFLSVLKTAKAVRVTRILRLIRIIKLFGKIQNAESPMANRHVGSIATMGVTAIVIALLISQFAPILHVGDRDAYLESRVTDLTHLMQTVDRAAPGAPDFNWLSKYLESSTVQSDIIRVRNQEEKLIYLNPQASQLMHSAYGAGQWISLGDSGYAAQISYHVPDAEHARLNLFVMVAILWLTLAFMLIYARMFAQQVADPLFVMNRGLRQWEYNLEVRIPAELANEEVFQLAHAYNERWLSLKNQIRAFRRQRAGAEEKSALSLDDVF